MDIEDYILKQPLVRQNILTRIHWIIVEQDKSVTAQVQTMMGKEMIVYKGNGVMKYALSSVKNYISLHLMPIYGSPALHAKYANLLNKAKFQKGCINFKKAEEMPLEIVRELLNDCAKIDLIALIEMYKMNRKP